MRPTRKHSLLPPSMGDGSYGKGVAAFQLILKGARVPSAARLEVNGQFGLIMRECVRELQVFLDMEPDGCVDEITMSGRMVARFGMDPWMIPATAFHDRTRRVHLVLRNRQALMGNRPLGRLHRKRGLFIPSWFAEGDKGRAVSVLHLFLAGAGFFKGIVFNGYFGHVTAQNVQRLQKFLRVEQTGDMDSETMDAIAQRYALDFRALLLAPFLKPTMSLVRGDTRPTFRWPPDPRKRLGRRPTVATSDSHLRL